jgi:hypothetical protein
MIVAVLLRKILAPVFLRMLSIHRTLLPASGDSQGSKGGDYAHGSDTTNDTAG